MSETPTHSPSKTRKLEDWLEAYMVHTYSAASPEIFHKWAALSIVAGALRRRVWIDHPDVFRLYPNLYTVLIGPPGSMKGTAMRMAQKLLVQIPGFDYNADSLSREKLILDLQQALIGGDCALSVFSSEFGSMFSVSGPEMANFLTDIYESPEKWSYRLKNQASVTVVNACLNLIACTQPETMAKFLPIHSIGLGLTSRMIFIYADTPRDRPWRQKKDQQQDAIRDLLLNDLHVITTLRGEFGLDADADAFYDSWYRHHMQHPHEATADDRLRPYFSRKHTHVLKVAMALSVMRRDELIIKMRELEEAFSLLAEVEQVMPMAFSSIGASLTASPMAKIVEVLSARNAPVEYGVLLDLLKRDVRRQEFDECLETLLITNAIQRVAIGGKVAYTVTQG